MFWIGAKHPVFLSYVQDFEIKFHVKQVLKKREGGEVFVIDYAF